MPNQPFVTPPPPPPPTPTHQACNQILDYSRKLARYANDDDLIPGLSTPSIHGGPWDVDNKRRDVREVFRVFVQESVARAVRGGGEGWGGGVWVGGWGVGG